MKLRATMQWIGCSLATAVLLTGGLTGCSKKVAVDTVKLEYSFQGADATNSAAVTQAIEAIDKGDSGAALTTLQKVAADPKLTAEQKTAVNDVVQQLQK
jgi:hypothetical protein